MGQDFFDYVDEGEPRASRNKPLIVGVVIILSIVCILAIRMFSGVALGNQITIERADDSSKPIGIEGDADGSVSDESSHGRISSSEGSADVRKVAVYVSGAVVAPGVYELDEGSRIDDAVKAAGGFCEGADRDACNLARVAIDGEQIHIPMEGENADNSGDVVATATADVGNSFGLVNINTANAQTLQTLPGVGPATAQKIVADREATGSFQTVDDLMRVAGIGEKKLESLRDLICV